MTRIMITGANGFVGSYLVNKLAEQYEIIAAVRDEVHVANTVETRVIPSIQSDSNWDGLLEDIDVIIHLAARVHVMKETAGDPLTAFREVNALGTKKLAEAAAVQGVKNFVFISSIKVNGEETGDEPFRDSDSPAPVDPYGISKWEAEQYLWEIQENTSIEVNILRAPVVYGPGVKGNILRIAKLVRTSIPLPFGKVHNRRTMLSLENLSRWVERAITRNDSFPKPILIGDPYPVSTRDLVVELGIGMGRRSILLPVPVTAMWRTARIIKRPEISQRLFSNLEIIPSFEAFPGIQEELGDPRQSLRALGVNLKNKN